MEQSQAGRETSVLLQHRIKSLLTVSSQTFRTFKTFLSPSEFPSMSHQRKNEFSQYNSLRKTTPSRYTKKGGALLKNFLKHSKVLRGKREETSSRRNWVIGILFGRESPHPLSICSIPHIHTSSTNIILHPFLRKKKKEKKRRECTSTLISPSFYTALTLMKYPDGSLHEQGPWTRNTFLNKAMLLLRTQPTHKQNTRKRSNQTSRARKHSKRNCDR